MVIELYDRNSLLARTFYFVLLSFRREATRPLQWRSISLAMQAQSLSKRLTLIVWIISIERMTIIYNQPTPVIGRREDRILRSVGFSFIIVLGLRKLPALTWRKTATIRTDLPAGQLPFQKTTPANTNWAPWRLSESLSKEIVPARAHLM